MTEITNIRLSRRAFAGGALGAFIVGGAPPLRAAPAQRITGLAFDKGTTFAVGDALLTSDDGGATWKPISGPDIGAIAITSHPKRPGRLVVSLEGGGLSQSTDGGNSFARFGRGLPDAQIDALATAAKLPDTLYAAIAGDGLWRSEDAGASWEFAMDRPFIGGDERDVLSLASVDLASGMGGIWLYGGTTSGVQRVPDCFCRWQDVQPENALDALVEGAETPEVVPLPEGQPVLSLVASPAAPNRLWAALPSGIWASTDAGVVWKQASQLAATALATDPNTPETLVAATESGLFHSRDGGSSWAASAVL